MKALIKIDEVADKSKDGIKRWLVKTTDNEYYSLSQWTKDLDIEDIVQNSSWLVDYVVKDGENVQFRNVKKITSAEDLTDSQKTDMRLSIIESKLDMLLSRLTSKTETKQEDNEGSIPF